MSLDVTDFFNGGMFFFHIEESVGWHMNFSIPAPHSLLNEC